MTNVHMLRNENILFSSKQKKKLKHFVISKTRIIQSKAQLFPFMSHNLYPETEFLPLNRFMRNQGNKKLYALHFHVRW